MASAIEELQKSLVNFLEVENAMVQSNVNIDQELLELMEREAATVEKLAAAEIAVANVVRRRRMKIARKWKGGERKRKKIFRHERIFLRRTDAFELNDDEFSALFCLTKGCVMNMCEELHEVLEPKACRRRNVFTVKEKILCALRFFATGCYQNSVKVENEIAMSQRSASRAINSVISAINDVLYERYVTFPTDPEEQKQLKRKFLELSGFPGVIGIVDSTHVGLVAPPTGGVYSLNSFQNKKGYFSMNIQLVCDPDFMIHDVCAEFPGSVPDSDVWRSSPVCELFNSGKPGTNGETWLLGDSSNPLEPWLLTPVIQPDQGSPEEKYNHHHSLALKTAEKCIMLLKSRFKCLLRSRPLYYSPTTIGKLVKACAAVHNICVQSKLPEPCEVYPDDDGFSTVESDTASASSGGAELQANVIKLHFS